LWPSSGPAPTGPTVFSPVLRAPELDAELQLGSHQSRVEGQNHLHGPAGHTSLDAVQDTVGLLGCKRTLPDHVDLLINSNSFSSGLLSIATVSAPLVM